MRRLWRSPTLRSVMVYGAAGAGFAAANLILARVLPPTEYAIVTLLVALLNLGFAAAPVGLDGTVNRVRLEAGPHLLSRSLIASVVVGLAFAAVAGLGYETSGGMTLLLLVAIIAGGPLTVAAAQFQSEQRYGPSLALLQSTNLIMFLAALVTVASGVRRASLTILVLTVGTIVCSVWGWTVLWRERHGKPHGTSAIPWRESFAYAGVQATGLLLIQVERLVLPHVLPLHELATYGVLAAVAGSLFRVLQMGVGYSLLPRLRSAPDARSRRRLVLREARLVGAIVLLGSLAIWVIVPLVERWLLAGKYDLTGPLVFAAIVSGVAKIVNAFTKATATALATAWELSIVNLVGWLSVGIAVVAAAVGARWGLAGVIYGVALGWGVRTAASLYVSVRHLREGAPAPDTEPGQPRPELRYAAPNAVGSPARANEAL